MKSNFSCLCSSKHLNNLDQQTEENVWFLSFIAALWLMFGEQTNPQWHWLEKWWPLNQCWMEKWWPLNQRAFDWWCLWMNSYITGKEHFPRPEHQQDCWESTGGMGWYTKRQALWHLFVITTAGVAVYLPNFYCMFLLILPLDNEDIFSLMPGIS